MGVADAGEGVVGGGGRGLEGWSGVVEDRRRQQFDKDRAVRRRGSAAGRGLRRRAVRPVSVAGAGASARWRRRPPLILSLLSDRHYSTVGIDRTSGHPSASLPRQIYIHDACNGISSLSFQFDFSYLDRGDECSHGL
jgi:hypothetical protein